MRITRPYQKTAAAYSFGMLLYYLTNVVYFERAGPPWLGEVYMIIYTLPAIVGLSTLPLSLKEHAYRLFLLRSLLIFIAFDIICMVTNTHFIIAKRWISYGLMVLLPMAFLALFLCLKNSQIKDI